MTLSDLDLLDIQIHALFRHDDAGRITTTNEPDPEPAPRVFWGRTTSGDLWRFRDDVPADAVATMEMMLAAEPPLTDLTDNSPVPQAILDELARVGPIAEVEHGPAWYIPDTLPPSTVAAIVGEEDVASLRPRYPYLADHLAELSPCAAVHREGVVVTVCTSVRITHQACEAGFDTIPEVRGRGYGPDAVAVWAAAVRATGRIPLYSTSWDNQASRRVAEKLGLVQYAVDLSIT